MASWREIPIETGAIANAPRPGGGLVFSGAGLARLPFVPLASSEGGRAPTGAGADRRTRDPPRGRADLRFAGDRRSMTRTGAPLGAPPRHFWRSVSLRRSSGPRFLGLGACAP